MKFRLALVGLFSLAALTASAQESARSAPKTPLPPQTPVMPFGQPGKSMLIIKDVMRYVLNPAAESFWQAGGEVDSGDQRNSRTSTNDAQWNDALAAAATVMESANLLTMDGRSRTDPDWAKWSADLNKAGASGIKAVQARDGDATFAAGSDMFEACAACHGKYIKRVPQHFAPLPDLPGDTKPAK